MATMTAARLHKVGAEMVIEQVPMPTAGASDIVVEVKACNLVPNLHNILANWQSWFPALPLPRLPAIFGLDTTGVVSEVGESVLHYRPGDRVYVNPGLSCGSCPACRRHQQINCENYTFMGYFGFGPKAQHLYDRYSYGGFCEYMLVPEANLVRLPDNVTFDQGARFGYLGTSFAALKKVGAGPQHSILIDGISGTLGLGAALNALAMGVGRIFGTGRNRALLDKVKALNPDRIEVFALQDGEIGAWISERTDGSGVDAYVNCLGPGASPDIMVQSIKTLRRGGKAVNISGVSAPASLDVFSLMCAQIDVIGSNWFTPAEGDELASPRRDRFARSLDL